MSGWILATLCGKDLYNRKECLRASLHSGCVGSLWGSQLGQKSVPQPRAPGKVLPIPWPSKNGLFWSEGYSDLNVIGWIRSITDDSVVFHKYKSYHYRWRKPRTESLLVLIKQGWRLPLGGRGPGHLVVSWDEGPGKVFICSCMTWKHWVFTVIKKKKKNQHHKDWFEPLIRFCVKASGMMALLSLFTLERVIELFMLWCTAWNLP